jgi:hypothetical protein
VNTPFARSNLFSDFGTRQASTQNRKGLTMTRKEFEQARMAIEQESFRGTCCDAMTYGIERNAFLCDKYQRLIALAKKTRGLSADTKLKQWRRQLDRSMGAKDRFEKLRAESKIHQQSSSPAQSSGLTMSVSAQMLSAD